MLVLTATPIPRTLVLTYFGDMDVSELREKPAGRQPIDTRTIPLDAPRRGRATRSAARSTTASASIGSARWSRNPRRSTSPPPRSASRSCSKQFGDDGRSGARPHEGRRQGRRHGALRRRRNAAPGRHHGDRSRRRCAGGDRHGDRARRALRPRAAAPVARPHRPRHRPFDLPPALQGAARRNRQGAARDPARDRGRLPHRRGRSAAARRRRPARHAPERRCPASASRGSKCTANFSAPRATTPR